MQLSQLNTPFSRTIEINGEEHLYFGGTAYLGIATNKKFIEHYQKGIQLFGLNNGTSRNNNIQLGIYAEAETFAAKKFNAEDALIVSSGYLAASLAVKCLSQSGEVRYAPQTHPALWLHEKPSQTGNFEKWIENLVTEINQSSQSNWVIVSNSMNNLFPEIYDFSALKEIDIKKSICLVVDDSHGIGVKNEGLSALSILPKQPNITNVVVASMAKGLGVDAGLVLSSNKLIERLKMTNDFIGASPPAAAGLYAFMQANDIYEAELQRLKVNMALLASKLGKKNTWRFVDGFPVYTTKNDNLVQELAAKKILISSFPYPTANDEVINRIVLSSWHTKKDIDKLMNSLSYDHHRKLI